MAAATALRVLPLRRAPFGAILRHGRILYNNHLVYRRKIHSKNDFAVVSDIDGVVIRGGAAVPGAAEVLEKVYTADVPFVFLTNGGGMLESEKANQLTNILGTKIPEDGVILSHSPMRALVDQYRSSPVLVLGGKYDPVPVFRAYGFEHVLRVEDVHAAHPLVHPDLPAPSRSAAPTPVRAVVVASDPLHWFRDLQILCDILGSDGRDIENSIDMQKVPIYIAAGDLLFQGAFPAPRFGMGAFRICLESLYKARFGRELKVNLFGKPHPIAFDFARQHLESRRRAKIKRFYMIGDNIASDIDGAHRAGPDWYSILVRTGVYRDGPHTADFLCEDIVEAWEHIQHREKLLPSRRKPNK